MRSGETLTSMARISQSGAGGQVMKAMSIGKRIAAVCTERQ
jgi:hypothetical protein